MKFNSWMFRHISGRVISEVCPGILAGKTQKSHLISSIWIWICKQETPLSACRFLLENYGWKCSIVFVQISFTHSGSNIAWCWLNLWLCCLLKKSEVEVDGCAVTILTTSKHQQFSYFYCMWISDWYVQTVCTYYVRYIESVISPWSYKWSFGLSVVLLIMFLLSVMNLAAWNSTSPQRSYTGLQTPLIWPVAILEQV